MREQAIPAMKEMRDSSHKHRDYHSHLKSANIASILYLSIILFPTSIIYCLSTRSISRQQRCFRFTVAFTLLFELIMSVIILSKVLIGIGEYREKNALFKNLDDSVQGCMDSYSDLVDKVIED